MYHTGQKRPSLYYSLFLPYIVIPIKSDESNFVTFTFLLFCNLIGMIPYCFTETSHFIITLGLSLSFFIGITIVGFQTHGLHFLNLLLPQGVPLPTRHTMGIGFTQNIRPKIPHYFNIPRCY